MSRPNSWTSAQSRFPLKSVPAPLRHIDEIFRRSRKDGAGSRVLGGVVDFAAAVGGQLGTGVTDPGHQVAVAPTDLYRGVRFHIESFELTGCAVEVKENTCFGSTEALAARAYPSGWLRRAEPQIIR